MSFLLMQTKIEFITDAADASGPYKLDCDTTTAEGFELLTLSRPFILYLQSFISLAIDLRDPLARVSLY